MRCEKSFLLVQKHWLSDNVGVFEKLPIGRISGLLSPVHIDGDHEDVISNHAYIYVPKDIL